MASKNVLAEAISKLVKANENLKTKIKVTQNKAEAEEMCKEVQKNTSMILDYKYRLEYDE